MADERYNVEQLRLADELVAQQLGIEPRLLFWANPKSKHRAKPSKLIDALPEWFLPALIPLYTLAEFFRQEVCPSRIRGEIEFRKFRKENALLFWFLKEIERLNSLVDAVSTTDKFESVGLPGMSAEKRQEVVYRIYCRRKEISEALPKLRVLLETQNSGLQVGDLEIALANISSNLVERVAGAQAHSIKRALDIAILNREQSGADSTNIPSTPKALELPLGVRKATQNKNP